MVSVTDLYALSLTEGIGDQTLRKIITTGKTLTELLKLGDEYIKKIISNQKSIDALKNNFLSAQSRADADLEGFRNMGIEIIDYFHPSYPDSYRLLEDYPIFLYCKGNVNLLKSLDNIAVIGTREVSEVGTKIARGTAAYFAQKGYTIVSGLAKGVDAVAHRAALEVRGKTIAVLIDVGKIYPKENLELANQIISQDGLLIAENRPNSFQGKNAFVLRDRLQSGLSLAIFPIETDIIGGTMHTVKYAKKQGRLNFVPNIHNPAIKSWYNNSVGPSYTKIRGIAELISTRQATPYVKDDYPEIEKQLENCKSFLMRQIIGLNSSNLFKENELQKDVNEGNLSKDKLGFKAVESTSISGEALDSNRLELRAEDTSSSETEMPLSEAIEDKKTNTSEEKITDLEMIPEPIEPNSDEEVLVANGLKPDEVHTNSDEAAISATEILPEDSTILNKYNLHNLVPSKQLSSLKAILKKQLTQESKLEKEIKNLISLVEDKNKTLDLLRNESIMIKAELLKLNDLPKGKLKQASKNANQVLFPI